MSSLNSVVMLVYGLALFILAVTTMIFGVLFFINLVLRRPAKHYGKKALIFLATTIFAVFLWMPISLLIF